MVQPRYRGQQRYRSNTQKEEYAKIGGILIVVGSALGILFGLFYALLGTAMMAGGLSFGVLCYLPLIFGAIGVVGGFMAIKRKSFTFSIVGGILGMFSAGFLWGFILCLAGVILVGISKKDFERSDQDSFQSQGEYRAQQQFGQNYSYRGYQRQRQQVPPNQPRASDRPKKQDEGYPPPPPPQKEASKRQKPRCEECGEEMSYIVDYGRWYCYNCRSYR